MEVKTAPGPMPDSCGLLGGMHIPGLWRSGGLPSFPQLRDRCPPWGSINTGLEKNRANVKKGS